MFDSTITMGNVIETITIVIGGMVFLFEMRNRLASLQTAQEYFKERLDKVDKEIGDLSKIATVIAQQSERITAFDMRMAAQSDRMTKMDERVDKVNEAMQQINVRLTEEFFRRTARRKKELQDATE